MLSAFITSLFPFDIFKILSQEDHLIENIQVVVLLLAALWALLFSRSLFKKKIKTHAFIFGLTALTLIMVAGDEISWGQRIFNFQTPKQVAPYNTQRETTIHNLSFFEKSVSTGYILLGLYGTVSWIIQSRFKNLKKQPFYFYIPPWFSSAYYFIGFLYNFYTRINANHHLGIWSEFSELMLYTGIMFTMYYLYKTKERIISK